MAEAIYDFETYVRSLPSRPSRRGPSRRMFLHGNAWHSAQGVWKRLMGDRENKRNKGNPARRVLRDAALTMLGDQCTKCGFNDKRALQMDHIMGGGNKHRKSLSSPTKYYKYVIEDNGNSFQLLCANCNMIKRTENNEFHRPALQEIG